MNDTTSTKDTLLIVDDMPNNVAILFNFLTRAGFEVLIAQGGRDGIETAEYTHPDLILLDIMMPDVDGFEVCKILKSKENTKDIPVIFMTALADTLDKVRGFSLGAADYITKPFQHEEVLARIRAHLELRKQRRQIESQKQQLQERAEELEKRNAELDAFAHTVAHDLKNPLSAVIGLASLLAGICSPDTLPDPKWVEQLQRIVRSSKRMLNIINALLLLAGISKQAGVEIKPIDMKQVLERVLQHSVKDMLVEYAGSIDFVAPATWPMVLGYAPWLEEVWVNYLSNGLKYGGQPPHLLIGSSKLSEDTVRFWVQDNGSGLTAQEQAKLFTPFTRLHKEHAEGHGLGLSIVRQIIEKLGGQVGVESQSDQGSQFYFSLPV
ncbi:MAG: hybrid sensor histidine kinase/response regulator, partial [Beggiatoa sp. IS2]